MHIMQQSGVMAIIAFLGSFATAAPTASEEKQSRNALFPRASDQCFSGASFNTDDFWAIENSFYSNTNWHYVDSDTCLSWKWGSVKVCACNRYPFDTTSIYDRTIGDALSHIGNCCLTSVCDGGQSTIRGNSGLEVDIEAVPKWSDC
jgi:hypothetical protein